MAKGPIVTDRVEALIASVHQKHPKWKAPMVRNEVSFFLRKENPKLPSSWPSLSTVQKVLAKVRRRLKELPVDPQDKPWNMGTLDEYPMPPDAILAVLNVWRFDEEQKHKFGKQGYAKFPFGLTIRRAKWASRLSRVIMDDTQRLSFWARQYADIEQIYQRVGHPFDSIALDSLLIAPFAEPFTQEFKAMIAEIDLLAQFDPEIEQQEEYKRIRSRLEEATKQGWELKHGWLSPKGARQQKGVQNERSHSQEIQE